MISYVVVTCRPTDGGLSQLPEHDGPFFLSLSPSLPYISLLLFLENMSILEGMYFSA